MNAYMYYLVRKFNMETTERAAAIDSFEMTSIWEGETAKVKVGGFFKKKKKIKLHSNVNCNFYTFQKITV